MPGAGRIGVRAAVAVLLLALPPPGVGGEAPPPPPGFSLGGDPERGRALWGKRCGLCHGEDGSGRGRIRTDPPPRDLRRREFHERRSDWEIYLVIKEGGRALGLSEKMLAWEKLLTDQEIRDLAAFVRTLVAGDGGEAPP